jgi:hypothetical protein
VETISVITTTSEEYPSILSYISVTEELISKGCNLKEFTTTSEFLFGDTASGDEERTNIDEHFEEVKL